MYRNVSHWHMRNLHRKKGENLAVEQTFKIFRKINLFLVKWSSKNNTNKAKIHKIK